MTTLSPHVTPPSPAATYAALLAIADLLGTDICWLHRHRYHFIVDGNVTIALSADSAGRFRIDSCRSCRPVTSQWVRPDEHARLNDIVRALNEHADERGSLTA